MGLYVYKKQLLSGSINGLPIPVNQVVSPGTTIHVAIVGTSAWDEVYLWVANVTGQRALLTIEWGGTADPAHHMCKQVPIPPFSRPIPIVTGQVLNGGLTVRAFTDAGNGGALNITGFSNRIQ